MDITNWLVQPKWQFNQDNTDIIKDKLNQLTSDVDDADALYTEMTTDSLDIDAVDVASNVWDKKNLPNNNYRVHQQLAVSHLVDNQWPLPSPTLLYTVVDDIIHPARNVVKNGQFANKSSIEEYALHLLGFSLSHEMLQDYAIYLAPNGDMIKNILNAIAHSDSLGIDVSQDNRFTNLDKFLQTYHDDDIVTPIITNNYDSNQYENADNFQNTTRFLMNRFIDTGDLVPVPINYAQMLAPTKILIFNVEQLGASTISDINDTLHDITLLNNNFKLKRVSSFKLVTKPSDIASSSSTQQFTRDDSSFGRRVDRQMSPISDPAARVHLIMQWANTKTNMSSSNSYTTHQKSFMKPNRRHPNNPNVAGRIAKTQYKRDIHIYLDTSGSINSQQYASGIQILAEAAKRLNVDIYFTSFSHITSSTVKLPTKNKSRSQIQNILMNIPKVSGGTCYENVYNDILQSTMEAQKKHQSIPINIMLTDFEYSLTNGYRIPSFISDNTFYMPLDPKGNNRSKINFMNQVVYATNKSVGFVRKHFA